MATPSQPKLLAQGKPRTLGGTTRAWLVRLYAPGSGNNKYQVCFRAAAGEGEPWKRVLRRAASEEEARKIFAQAEAALDTAQATPVGADVRASRTIRLLRGLVRLRTAGSLRLLLRSELATAIHRAVFSPLAALSDYERRTLLKTIGDCVSRGGSIASVAERMFRHRNTVRARLRQFTELTGLDLPFPTTWPRRLSRST